MLKKAFTPEQIVTKLHEIKRKCSLVSVTQIIIP